MKRSLLIFGVVLECCTAAHAQTVIGRDAGRVVIERHAACTIDSKYSQVIESLSTPRDYKRDRESMGKLMRMSCLAEGRSINADPIVYRGALFRALVRKTYPGSPSSFGVDPYVDTGSWASILNFASCVVRADPTDAHDVVMAQAGSEAENTAFGALKIPIERCVPWKTMAWTKENLIYFFSEAYYHEAGGMKSASSN